MFISIYIMKVCVVILALAGAGYAAYKMKKNPENKTSMIVFMALGLAIAWFTTAAEIRRSETGRILITPNSVSRVEEQDLDKAVQEAKKKAEERAEQAKERAKRKLYYIIFAQKEPRLKGLEFKNGVVTGLEDGRYGTEFTFKPATKTNLTLIEFSCITENDADIVGAEVMLEPKPKQLDQVYMYDKLFSKTSRPKLVRWDAEYYNNKSSEINLLVITESDPVNVKCYYNEVDSGV